MYVCNLISKMYFYRKQILVDISGLSDLSSEKFKKIQKKVGNALESIKPTEEYKDFTEKFK